ncbi:MAG: hypothetical protein ACO3A4_12590 [Silvanigrellaceae bacterium]
MMTSKIIRYLLRAVIVLLVALPLAIPFIQKSVERQPPKNLTVWTDASLKWNDLEQNKAIRQLRSKLSLESEVRINFRKFGSMSQTPIQDYEDLIAQLESATGEQVVVSTAALWGPAARNFQREILKIAKGNRKILLLKPQDLSMAPPRRSPEKFLALSELSAPQLNFLGEPSQLSLEIVGRLDSGESQNIEVVVRSGESLLTSKSINVTANADGLVNSIENIPVHFTRAQQQLLTAQLSSELSPVPLNVASVPVTVVHSKSTVLHIGVGPDWSMRNMRTKLKFWPNLDLLSYYILREVSDDLSIPSNQLSLIEFPAEKLFGVQLPNFHGVLAQNFVFDSYFNSNDTQNLYDYVNNNGGRLVIQAGPLSFLGSDGRIRELSPCENFPEFEFDKARAWRVGKNRFVSESQFEAAVGQIVTRQNAIGCKPKPGALVLAETDEEKPSPMIVAYPVGKGLVVAILSGDWHTFATQNPADNASQKAHRVYAIDASERLFQWMVEFLQRRQDSGLRPPQFAGPRLYRDDSLHLVRSRGGLPENSMLQGVGQGFSGLMGRPFWLSRLTLEAIAWDKLNVGSAFPSQALVGGSTAQETARAPRYESVGLAWQTNETSGLPKQGSNQVVKPMIWPMFDGTMREREWIANPALFPVELTKFAAQTSEPLSRPDQLREQRVIPLLNAYPWLLALLFALLAIEQLIVRLSPGRPEHGSRQGPTVSQGN